MTHARVVIVLHLYSLEQCLNPVLRTSINTHIFVTFYKFLIHLGVHHTRRNWYLYHNITTKLLCKKHNISTKMIPFGARHPLPINHHNIPIDRVERIRHSSSRPWNSRAMRNRRSRWRRGSLARRRVKASTARMVRR